MPQFIYASWNMKNLSWKSIFRQFSDNGVFGATQHTTLQAYTKLIKANSVDIIGILEVTPVTGESAVTELCLSLNLKNKSKFKHTITSTKTFPTRTGEFNAIIYKETAFTDITVSIDPHTTVREVLFPQNTSGGTRFLNRVPVLFTINFSNPAKTLQLVTWHCPQPKDVNANNELKALAESLMDFWNNKNNNNFMGPWIDEKMPLLISGDFNFDTDRGTVKEWTIYFPQSTTTGPATKRRRTTTGAVPTSYNGSSYLPNIMSLLNGQRTTLVKKDPATRSLKRFIPNDFDDVLCNAYDNILYHSPTLNHVGTKSAVINHYKELISKDGKTFLYIPGVFDDEIKNANKISDHCMVVSTFQFK